MMTNQGMVLILSLLTHIISRQLMPQQMYSQTSENKVEYSKNMQQPVLDANFM